MDEFFPWIVSSTSVKKELCRSRAGGETILDPVMENFSYGIKLNGDVALNAVL